ncbi:MAG TPA: hypothetical protein VJH63_00370 [Candidatus Paceibacterota bacterium]
MSNFLTKKHKIFPKILESKSWVLGLIFFFVGLAYIGFISIQSLIEQRRCEERGFTWFSTASWPVSAEKRILRRITGLQTAGHYTEHYESGVCADMKSK